MTARIAPEAIAARNASPKAPARDRARAAGLNDILQAPFLLRCGAFLIDYMLLAGTVAVSTILARVIGGGARTNGGRAELFGIFAAIMMAVINFGLLTSTTGQSIGKWATGLRIHRTDGADMGWGRSLVRHFLGYPLSFVIFGLGFFMVVFNARGRALHDLIAGTVVTRDAVRSNRTVGRRS